jgi:hypothetical protein
VGGRAGGGSGGGQQWGGQQKGGQQGEYSVPGIGCAGSCQSARCVPCACHDMHTQRAAVSDMPRHAHTAGSSIRHATTCTHSGQQYQTAPAAAAHLGHKGLLHQTLRLDALDGLLGAGGAPALCASCQPLDDVLVLLNLLLLLLPGSPLQGVLLALWGTGEGGSGACPHLLRLLLRLRLLLLLLLLASSSPAAGTTYTSASMPGRFQHHHQHHHQPLRRLTFAATYWL